MTISFNKYEGAGNDFILIDNRTAGINLNKEQVGKLCHRHFGIGADGLMLLEDADGFDFRMIYYNSDGGESTMCGNGGRCITAFAKRLGIIETEANFVAIDGPHHATIHADHTISLHMKDVDNIEHNAGYSILNTGSPHYILWVDDAKQADVFNTGRGIRNQDEFTPGGINVNFVQRTNDGLLVRTYERGVEDETLSCGTGVTAAAIAASRNETGRFTTPIQTPGGMLEISFIKDLPGSAKNVVLKGPATFVFAGAIEF